MGEVISLQKFNEERSPHLAGKARCICGHEWAAVAPVGAVELECPRCHTMRGLMYANVSKEGNHVHCQCGMNMFRIHSTEGIYCPSCGMEFSIADLPPLP